MLREFNMQIIKQTIQKKTSTCSSFSSNKINMQ
jgi:hypothetical protein